MATEHLKEILADIQRKYETEIVPVTVSGRTLHFLCLKDPGELVLESLERSDVDLAELPFWGKIWEAGLLLAAYLVAQPVVPQRQILEIGAGMGVSGLFAASCGHRITLSDCGEDRLQFAQANALLNDLDTVPIVQMDWRKPAQEPLYDWIVGSEVVYHRQTYDELVEFLNTTLKPQGTIFLAKSTGLPASGFFSRLTRYFKFKRLDKVMRCEDREYAISLYAIKRKGEA